MGKAGGGNPSPRSSLRDSSQGSLRDVPEASIHAIQRVDVGKVSTGTLGELDAPTDAVLLEHVEGSPDVTTRILATAKGQEDVGVDAIVPIEADFPRLERHIQALRIVQIVLGHLGNGSEEITERIAHVLDSIVRNLGIKPDVLTARLLSDVLESRDANGHTIPTDHRKGTRDEFPEASAIAGVVGNDFREHLFTTTGIEERHRLITRTESDEVLIVSGIGFPADGLLGIDNAPSEIFEAFDDFFRGNKSITVGTLAIVIGGEDRGSLGANLIEGKERNHSVAFQARGLSYTPILAPLSVESKVICKLSTVLSPCPARGYSAPRVRGRPLPDWQVDWWRWWDSNPRPGSAH